MPGSEDRELSRPWSTVLKWCPGPVRRWFKADKERLQIVAGVLAAPAFLLSAATVCVGILILLSIVRAFIGWAPACYNKYKGCILNLREPHHLTKAQVDDLLIPWRDIADDTVKVPTPDCPAYYVNDVHPTELFHCKCHAHLTSCYQPESIFFIAAIVLASIGGLLIMPCLALGSCVFCLKSFNREDTGQSTNPYKSLLSGQSPPGVPLMPLMRRPTVFAARAAAAGSTVPGMPAEHAGNQQPGTGPSTATGLHASCHMSPPVPVQGAAWVSDACEKPPPQQQRVHAPPHDPHDLQYPHAHGTGTPGGGGEQGRTCGEGHTLEGERQQGEAARRQERSQEAHLVPDSLSGAGQGGEEEEEVDLAAWSRRAEALQQAASALLRQPSGNSEDE